MSKGVNPSPSVHHVKEHDFHKIIKFLFSYTHIIPKHQCHLLKNKLQISSHNIYGILHHSIHILTYNPHL